MVNFSRKSEKQNSSVLNGLFMYTFTVYTYTYTILNYLYLSYRRGWGPQPVLPGLRAGNKPRFRQLSHSCIPRGWDPQQTVLPGLRAGNKPRFRQLSNNLKIISSKSMMRIWEQIKINSKTILILEMGFLVLKMIVQCAWCLIFEHWSLS